MARVLEMPMVCVWESTLEIGLDSKKAVMSAMLLVAQTVTLSVTLSACLTELS